MKNQNSMECGAGRSRLAREHRWAVLGQRGATLWLTGLSGSGKSTIGDGLAAALAGRGLHAYRLDGDDLRTGLCADLGFSLADRMENVRRAGEVARLLADSGAIVVASLISPYEEGRLRCKRAHESAGIEFLEVYLATPIEVCEERDPKGLYAKARRGELRGLTGIDDPYEAPRDADLVLKPHQQAVGECVAAALALLESREIVSPGRCDGQG